MFKALLYNIIAKKYREKYSPFCILMRERERVDAMLQPKILSEDILDLSCIYIYGGQILGKKTQLCPIDGVIALCILVPYLAMCP